MFAYTLKAFFTTFNHIALTSADSLLLPTTLRPDVLFKPNRKNKISYTQPNSEFGLAYFIVIFTIVCKFFFHNIVEFFLPIC